MEDTTAPPIPSHVPEDWWKQVVSYDSSSLKDARRAADKAFYSHTLSLDDFYPIWSICVLDHWANQWKIPPTLIWKTLSEILGGHSQPHLDNQENVPPHYRQELGIRPLYAPSISSYFMDPILHEMSYSSSLRRPEHEGKQLDSSKMMVHSWHLLQELRRACQSAAATPSILFAKRARRQQDNSFSAHLQLTLSLVFCSLASRRSTLTTWEAVEDAFLWDGDWCTLVRNELDIYYRKAGLWLWAWQGLLDKDKEEEDPMVPSADEMVAKLASHNFAILATIQDACWAVLPNGSVFQDQKRLTKPLKAKIAHDLWDRTLASATTLCQVLTPMVGHLATMNDLKLFMKQEDHKYNESLRQRLHSKGTPLSGQKRKARDEASDIVEQTCLERLATHPAAILWMDIVVLLESHELEKVLLILAQLEDFGDPNFVLREAKLSIWDTILHYLWHHGWFFLDERSQDVEPISTKERSLTKREIWIDWLAGKACRRSPHFQEARKTVCLFFSCMGQKVFSNAANNTKEERDYVVRATQCTLLKLYMNSYALSDTPGDGVVDYCQQIKATMSDWPAGWWDSLSPDEHPPVLSDRPSSMEKERAVSWALRLLNAKEYPQYIPRVPKSLVYFLTDTQPNRRVWNLEKLLLSDEPTPPTPEKETPEKETASLRRESSESSLRDLPSVLPSPSLQATLWRPDRMSQSILEYDYDEEDKVDVGDSNEASGEEQPPNSSEEEPRMAKEPAGSLGDSWLADQLDLPAQDETASSEANVAENYYSSGTGEAQSGNSDDNEVVDILNTSDEESSGNEENEADQHEIPSKQRFRPVEPNDQGESEDEQDESNESSGEEVVNSPPVRLTGRREGEHEEEGSSDEGEEASYDSRGVSQGGKAVGPKIRWPRDDEEDSDSDDQESGDSESHNDSDAEAAQEQGSKVDVGRANRGSSADNAVEIDDSDDDESADEENEKSHRQKFEDGDDSDATVPPDVPDEESPVKEYAPSQVNTEAVNDEILEEQLEPTKALQPADSTEDSPSVKSPSLEVAVAEMDEKPDRPENHAPVAAEEDIPKTATDRTDDNYSSSKHSSDRKAPAVDDEPDSKVVDDDDAEEPQDDDKAESEIADVGDDIGETTEEEKDVAEDHSQQEESASRQADYLASNAYGYGSQIEDGYEPEDTLGYTEEEVSEAIHTEDEEEERRNARARLHQEVEEEAHINNVAPVRPGHDIAHSSDDMDAADEHTEPEEDLGAESSELEEAPEQHIDHLPSQDFDAAPGSLVDFAQRTQVSYDYDVREHRADERRFEEERKAAAAAAELEAKQGEEEVAVAASEEKEDGEEVDSYSRQIIPGARRDSGSKSSIDKADDEGGMLPPSADFADGPTEVDDQMDATSENSPEEEVLTETDNDQAGANAPDEEEVHRAQVTEATGDTPDVKGGHDSDAYDSTSMDVEGATAATAGIPEESTIGVDGDEAAGASESDAQTDDHTTDDKGYAGRPSIPPAASPATRDRPEGSEKESDARGEDALKTSPPTDEAKEVSFAQPDSQHPGVTAMISREPEGPHEFTPTNNGGPSNAEAEREEQATLDDENVEPEVDAASGAQPEKGEEDIPATSTPTSSLLPLDESKTETLDTGRADEEVAKKMDVEPEASSPEEEQPTVEKDIDESEKSTGAAQNDKMISEEKEAEPEAERGNDGDVAPPDTSLIPVRKSARVRGRKKAFPGLDEEAGSDDDVAEAKAPPSPVRKSSRTRGRKKATVPKEEETEDEVDKAASVKASPVATRKSARTRGRKKTTVAEGEETEDEDAGEKEAVAEPKKIEDAVPTRKSARTRGRKKTTVAQEPETEDEEAPTTDLKASVSKSSSKKSTPSRTSRRSARAKPSPAKKTAYDEMLELVAEAKEDVTSPGGRSGRVTRSQDHEPPKAVRTSSRRSTRAAAASTDGDDEETSDDGSRSSVASRTRRGTRGRGRPKMDTSLMEDVIPEEIEVSPTEEEVAPVRKSSRRAAKKKVDDDEDDASTIPSPPRTTRTTRRATKAKKDDEEEDSVVPSIVRQTRQKTLSDVDSVSVASRTRKRKAADTDDLPASRPSTRRSKKKDKDDEEEVSVARSTRSTRSSRRTKK